MTISLQLPVVGSDEDTWGSKINAALSTLVDGVNSAATAAATASSAATSASTAATAASTAASTATTTASAASTAATAAQTAASSAAATANAVQTAITAMAAESVLIPAQLLAPFSGTFSTQTTKGIKSTCVFDAGTSANVAHLYGIGVPTDWQSFKIEFHGRPFGPSATATAMRLSATCVQYVSSDDLWNVPAANLVTVQMPINTQAGVVCESAVYTRDATKPVAAIYLTRDHTDALDTSGTRLVPTGVRLVRVS